MILGYLRSFSHPKTAIMVFFNGSMKLKICEAVELRPTDYSARFSMGATKKDVEAALDPYIAFDVDEAHVARTTTKAKTSKPTWNEEFTAEIHNGQNFGLTVFHDAALPPDVFVANCSLSFQDLKNQSDIWVRILIIAPFNPQTLFRFSDLRRSASVLYSIGESRPLWLVWRLGRRYINILYFDATQVVTIYVNDNNPLFLFNWQLNSMRTYFKLCIFQIDLEPSGKIHVIIELNGSASEGRNHH